MKNVGGPKGVDPAQKGGKILPLRDLKRVEHLENKTDSHKPVKISDEGSTFDPQASREIAMPDASAEVVRGAGVKARLTALGVKGGDALPIKGREVVRVKETPLGKILDGSVTVESPAGLQKLVGVVRISGDLTVQEAKLAGGDVTPANTLIEIGGRLTIEGVTS